MKIYKFYCKSEKLHRNDSFSSGKYELYGITNDKKLAEIFKKTRNMKDCFKLIAEKYNDETEWDTLKHEYPTHVILRYPLQGYPDKTLLSGTIVEFALTLSEKLIIEDACESFVSMFTMALANPIIFTKEVRKSLHKLKYMEFYRVLSSSSPQENYVLDMIDRVYPGEDYDYPSITVDEIELFIDSYSELLDIKND